MEVKLSEETNNSNDLILKLLSHMADLQKENHELRTENFKVKTEVAVLRDSHIKLQNAVGNIVKQVNEIKSKSKGKAGF